MSNAPTLRLQSANREYLLGADISLDVVLGNYSEAVIVVNRRLLFAPGLEILDVAYELDFVVINPRGKLIHPDLGLYKMSSLVPQAEDFEVLRPGDECNVGVTISNYFEMHDIGSYLVQGLYHNDYAGSRSGIDAWRGNIQSNQIQIDIIQLNS